MKRKTSSTPTRIWTYGLLPPRGKEDEKAVRDQLHRAHRYQNVLIEIERERRTAYRAARTAASPDLERLEKRVKELTDSIETQRREIKSLRKATRERTVHTAANRTLKLLQTERAQASKACKAERLRAAESPELRAGADAINTRATERVKEARNQSGLYWGTYLLIERAMEAAARGKDDPKFKRFRGDGRVGVQIQKGMTVAELFSGEDTRLRIRPLPEGTWDTRPGRRHALTGLQIRIGSEKGKPVWATFEDLLQHRPLPEDGIIKWAWLKLERIGTRTRWTFQLTLESAAFIPRKHKPSTDGIVAVNLGWRQKEDKMSLRVALAVDEAGVERELVMPSKLRGAILHSDHIRSVNDKIFDEARKELGAWMKTTPEHLPDWVKEETEHLGAWHAHGKLVRVARRFETELTDEGELGKLWHTWKVHRFQRGKDLYDSRETVTAFAEERGLAGLKAMAFWLFVWLKKNDHLYNWEASERNRALGYRKDLYRNWAVGLAREYQTLLIEKFDLREVAERPRPEDNQDHVQAAARARTHAAPSELRSALLAAFHGDHVEQSADHNTLACKACGTVTDDMPADAVVITCPGCGSAHDQDRNNCENQLARYRGNYKGPIAAE